MQTQLQQKLIESREAVQYLAQEYLRVRATGDAKAIEIARWWLKLTRLCQLYFEAMVAAESVDLETKYDEQPDFLPIREPQKMKGH